MSNNNQKNQSKREPQKNQASRLNKYAHYSGIAFQMIAIIGIGTFAGIKLDEKYPNTYRLFSVILSFSSVIIAIIFVIRRIIAASKDEKE